MFFYLSKILEFLLSPLVWIFILLVWGLITRKAILKKKLLIVSAVMLYLFSNGFLLSEVMRVLEPDPVILPAEKYSHAVVLGGMIGYSEALDRPAFYRSSDRFLQALSLLSEGKVDKLILSGGSGRLVKEKFAESDLLKNYLTGIGIPEDNLLVESQSRNTRENAIYTAMLLEKLKEEGGKIGPVLLVTSAFHMPRAEGCFRKAGVEVIVYPVDYYASRSRRFHPDHLLVPDPEVLFLWDMVIHETVGRIIYSIAGYT